MRLRFPTVRHLPTLAVTCTRRYAGVVVDIELLLARSEWAYMLCLAMEL